MVATSLAALVPALPLLGTVLIASLRGRLQGNASGIIGTGLVAVSFLISCLLFMKHEAGAVVLVPLFDWIAVAGMRMPMALQIDALSLTMMLIVTGVGALIHLYSIGYMHDDRRVNTFFAMLNLFTFAMLLLVMGANYLVLFIGWEGVGLCSYLLIGFWYTNPAYNYAARKAFVMNRIGDVGMLLALVAIFFVFGTLDFAGVFTMAGALGSGGMAGTFGLTAITLLLFFGATGKSAQIPLFTWLPDAMAGPTPVSALIHAATMVTAGIYMIVRSSALFILTPFTNHVIVVIGMATALMAAFIALRQNDIKKILAYSTVSQLGYMFLALGLGAYASGMFHVTTHAFFKALLFLGAGSVIHALAGEQDVRKMGGLRKALPITFITMLIGTLAIAGIPPFAGFFSKDQILSAAFERGPVLYALALFGALLTCFYMFRLLYLAFWGTYRGEAHPHESPRVMTYPLIALAALSVLGGFLDIPHHFGGHNAFTARLGAIANPLGMEPHHPPAMQEWLLIALSVALLLVVIVVAYVRFAKRQTIAGDDEAAMSFLQRLLHRRFFVDELYDALFEKPYALLGDLNGTVEKKMIDGVVNDVGATTTSIARLTRKLQTGNASFYLLAMTIGIVLFLAFTFLVP